MSDNTKARIAVTVMFLALIMPMYYTVSTLVITLIQLNH